MLWIISAPPLYQSSEGQHADAAERYEYQPGPGCTPFELGQITSAFERAAQARECKNQAEDHRREIDDLIQQTRAAEAVERANWLAEANFRLSRLQLILSALGAAALIYTLILSREATKAAAASAQAARDAVSAERAWVVWHKCSTGFDRSGGFGIAIDWHNAGRSPAIRVSVYHRTLLTGPNNYSHSFPFDEPKEGASAILGPGISLASDYLSISPEEYQKVKNGDLVWLHYCRVTYSTVFEPEKRFHTEMCASVEIYGEKIGDKGQVLPQFDMAPVGPQNTAT